MSKPNVKRIRNRKLMDVIGELMRDNVVVHKMYLTVDKDGEVNIEDCEYEELPPKA